MADSYSPWNTGPGPRGPGPRPGGYPNFHPPPPHGHGYGGQYERPPPPPYGDPYGRPPPHRTPPPYGEPMRGGRGGGRGGRGAPYGGGGGAPYGGGAPRFPAPKRPGNFEQQEQQGMKKARVSEYFCATCDREFKTMTEYNVHVSQHEKCSHPGCGYTAHRKLIKAHQFAQHANNKVDAKKIWSMSPEDIAQWKAERRKNFPTKQNIDAKERLRAEKKARGEVIEQPYNNGNMRGGGRGRGRGRGGDRGRGKGGDRGRGRGGDRGRGGGRGGQQHQPNQQGGHHQHNTQNEVKPGAPPKPAVFQGDPLSILADRKSDYDGEESAKKTAVKPVALPGALGLLGAYSGTESEEDTPEESTKTQKFASEAPAQTTTENTHGHGQGAKKQRKKNKFQKGRPLKIQDHKLTLLQKLLAPEIRHERNLIMQCVRYVVEQNFFRKQPSTTNKKEEKDSTTETLKNEINSNSVTTSNNVTDENNVTTSNNVTDENSVTNRNSVTNSNDVTDGNNVNNSSTVTDGNSVNNSSTVTNENNVTDENSVTNIDENCVTNTDETSVTNTGAQTVANEEDGEERTAVNYGSDDEIWDGEDVL